MGDYNSGEWAVSRHRQRLHAAILERVCIPAAAVPLQPTPLPEGRRMGRITGRQASTLNEHSWPTRAARAGLPVRQECFFQFPELRTATQLTQLRENGMTSHADTHPSQCPPVSRVLDGETAGKEGSD